MAKSRKQPKPNCQVQITGGSKRARKLLMLFLQHRLDGINIPTEVTPALTADEVEELDFNLHVRMKMDVRSVAIVSEEDKPDAAKSRKR